MLTLAAVYTGTLRELPEGQQTGIFKTSTSAKVWIGPEGLQGDVQADRRVHGGPEKAVHQMSTQTYERLQVAFPHLSAKLTPGSLGENLTIPGMDDFEVCIGDCWRVGEALLQVNQMRRPCWKINHRFDEDGLSHFLQESHATGWYYRVLEPGFVQAGDPVALEAQPHPGYTLAALWQLYQEQRPTFEALADWAALPALTLDWRIRLQQRHDWQRANP